MWVSPDWVSACAETLMTLVALCALFYARGQVTEARRTREDQSRPYVVCYLEIDPNIPNAADLVIRNYGLTAAYNVVVTFDATPERGVPADHVARIVSVPECFPVLAPGQEWRTHFDSGSNDRENFGLPMQYTGTIEYSTSKEKGRDYSTDVVLDYDQFLNRLYSEKKRSR